MKKIIVSLLVLSLSACGWHLRGSAAGGDKMAMTAPIDKVVIATDDNSPVINDDGSREYPVGTVDNIDSIWAAGNFCKGFDRFLCLHLGVDPEQVIACVRETQTEAELDVRLKALFPADLRVAVWNRELVQKGMSPMGREARVTGVELRDELMVRLRAEAAIGPAGLAQEVARRQAMHQAKLDVYQRIEQRDFIGKEPSRERRLQHLVLKAGILQEQVSLAIAKEALEILGDPAA